MIMMIFEKLGIGLVLSSKASHMILLYGLISRTPCTNWSMAILQKIDI